MASVVKRGPYQYQAQIRREGYPSQFKTFETKTEADAWVKVIESEMIRGVFIDRTKAERTSLGEALTLYLAEVTPHKKSAESESSLIARLQKNPLAKRSMASLRGMDFAAYRDARRDNDKVSANTIRIELALISHVFTVAKSEWGICVDNPIASIRKPKLPNGRDRRLVEDEESRLLMAAAKCRSANDGLRVAISIAIETGMRAGEIVALTWRQIDFAKHSIRLGITKNGQPRDVPMSVAAEQILRTFPRSIDASKRLFSFHDTRGLSSAFRLACKKADVHGLRFHDLRHEAASRMAPCMQVATLAKVMGWLNIQMAMRYYNPTAQELVAAVRSIA